MNWEGYLKYDESSPTFLRWVVFIYKGTGHSSIHRRPGDIAGTFTKYKDGTAMAVSLKFKGKRYKAHRIIWELFHGKIPPGMVIDHEDGNPFNNDISNLICKTSQGNSQNRKKNKNNSTGKTGVRRMKCSRTGDIKYYEAYASNLGKWEKARFSIEKLGDAVAFQMACEWRDDKILEYNLNGANYTERHING
jgi:hypothetical protein